MEVGIIGCGNVGMSTAFALIYSDKVNVVRVYNRDKNKLMGVVLDLKDAAFINNKTIVSSTIDEMKACDYVIITTGRKQKIDEERKALLNENKKIVAHFLKLLNNYKGKVVLVSNPVDMLTTYARELFPDLDIISTHTRIDEVRLHQITNGEGIIKGNHDYDKRVVINGRTNVELTELISERANEIIYGKGDTCFGIAAVVKEMIESDQDRKQGKDK